MSVQLAASHVPTDVLFVGARDRDGDRPNGDQVTGYWSSTASAANAGARSAAA
jgi:hypothetical protein